MNLSMRECQNSILEWCRDYWVALVCVATYGVLVRYLRYQRSKRMKANFGAGKRPLSSMTTEEAYDIMTQLQELEFPSAMSKARTVALLKAGHCHFMNSRIDEFS
jgi:hypothetical protein